LRTVVFPQPLFPDTAIRFRFSCISMNIGYKEKPGMPIGTPKSLGFP
jgi:hypothetical protein